MTEAEQFMGETVRACALRWRMEYGWQRGVAMAQIFARRGDLKVMMYYHAVGEALEAPPRRDERALIRAYEWAQKDASRNRRRGNRARPHAAAATGILPEHITPRTPAEQREIEEDLKLRIRLIQEGKLPRYT